MLSLAIHDLPTRSASGFLIRYVVPRSIPPQLVGPLSNRLLFDMLSIGDVIIGVGHGAPDTFCGWNNLVIMDTTSIPDVDGKVVVLISCQTAQELGPSLIESGAISYLGFNEDLTWVCDADKAATPWGDEIAQPMMMPIVNGINTILDGKPVGEAYNRILEDLSRNAEAEEDGLVKSCINFNRKNTVILGDPAARVPARPRIIFPFPPPPIVLPLRI